MGRPKTQHAHTGQYQIGAATTDGEDKIGSCTEYVENYLEWSLEGRVRGKPLVQQLSVGGEFSGKTENRERFVAHPIPPVFVPQKAVWSGTGLPFDGTTTQRTDFPIWDIAPHAAKEKPQWISSSGKFDGQTTSKTDFRDMGVQPRYQRKPQQYVPNAAKFDGLSSHKEAFQSWPINSKPVGRHYDAYAPLKDDRDFKSTTASAYIDHPMDSQFAEQQKGQFFFPPPDSKFEGQTTSQDAYRKWNVKPRERRAKVEYVPNTSKFPSDTTYTDNFQAKSVALNGGEVRMSKFGPTYTPVASCKFDGISTHKADYLPTTGNVHKLPDFAPKKGYIYQKDDRDFMTSSRKAHDLKTA
ncbi:hypothetical protein BDR26DRAFT_869374 [Obelidium mucronatum]|nr:hypothetical protein BDR26DRAFT_869374 [Obelidium mucronatum]